jgi:DNA-binding NtrC family response regulator
LSGRTFFRAAGEGAGSPVTEQAEVTGSTGEGTSLHLPGGEIVFEEVEKDLIRQALERTAGNQTRAAEALGLTRDALRYRMKEFGFS